MLNGWERSRYENHTLYLNLFRTSSGSSFNQLVVYDMESFDNKSGAVVDDNAHGVEPQVAQNGLHLARRGGDMVDSDVDSADIQGFDTDRMRARTLLTAEEEKKLLRRIDWHIMPLCSFMFLLKNMDAQNISNARIMNLDTPRNIMTQLGLSSNEYALLVSSNEHELYREINSSL